MDIVSFSEGTFQFISSSRAPECDPPKNKSVNGALTPRMVTLNRVLADVLRLTTLGRANSEVVNNTNPDGGRGLFPSIVWLYASGRGSGLDAAQRICKLNSASAT